MVAISALKPGDQVWSVTRQKAGNTSMKRTVCHGVRVIEVHDDHVVASWNGNPAQKFREAQVRRWKRSRPE